MAFPHLTAYEQWKNRAPDADLASDAYLQASDSKLKNQGFPEKVSRAFLNTANTLNSAILTRVPGKAATTLIDDGYCLKSFFVHAKSCNWGPMAGFVAFFPALSKKGVDHDQANTNAHLETLEKFKELILASQAKDREALVNDGQRHDQRETIATSPFLPLGLTPNAFQRLLTDGSLDPQFFYRQDNWVVGMASNQDQNVFMEYLLVKTPYKYTDTYGNAEEYMWFAYHRNIYIKRNDRYETYLVIDVNGKMNFCQPHVGTNGPGTGKNLLIPPYLPLDITPELSTVGKRLQEISNNFNLHASTSGNLTNFYPILVTQNPYPTYLGNDPRNAVTGDYDLFSVWPAAVFNRLEEVIRISESKIAPPPARLFAGALFAPIRGKNTSMQLVHAPNVYIEIIPSFKEIEGLEHPVLGNINDGVHLAAGMLNAMVYAEYQKPKNAPNVAFHSDEGGRPEVFEIEFPVAAFIPAGVKRPPESPNRECIVTNVPYGLVLKNASDFMTFIELLKDQAIIPLAYGWLMHLIILVAEETVFQSLYADATPLRDKRINYLNARRAERQHFGDLWLQMLRAQVWCLLTGYDIEVDSVLIKEDVKQAMAQATRVFFGLLYSTETVYDKMLKIREITMPPAA
jgi:hypothetical protein